MINGFDHYFDHKAIARQIVSPYLIMPYGRSVRSRHKSYEAGQGTSDRSHGHAQCNKPHATLLSRSTLLRIRRFKSGSTHMLGAKKIREAHTTGCT
jgi:hypothetical protein